MAMTTSLATRVVTAYSEAAAPSCVVVRHLASTADRATTNSAAGLAMTSWPARRAPTLTAAARDSTLAPTKIPIAHTTRVSGFRRTRNDERPGPAVSHGAGDVPTRTPACRGGGSLPPLAACADSHRYLASRRAMPARLTYELPRAPAAIAVSVKAWTSVA